MPPTHDDRAAATRRRRSDQLLELVGRDRRVLLVEPADTTLAAELTERGCLVTEGFADGEGLGHGEGVDVVVLDGVLGAAADPQALLKDAASALATGGVLVVTAPNAAHAARRLALLGGDLGEEAGTAPSRAFTLTTLCDLLEGASLVVDAVHGVVLDPVESEVTLPAGRLPDAVVEWVRHQPEALYDSFAVAARPRGVDEQEPAVRPRVQSDRPLEAARVVDEHTARAQALADDAHRRLTQRDAIIGLEATAQHAQFRRDLALAAVKVWKKRTRKWRTAHEVLVAEVVRAAEARKPAEALRALAERCRGLVAEPRDPAEDES